MRDIELNPGVLTEANVTVQADILLRTPEEGVSSCESFHWQSVLFIILPP